MSFRNQPDQADDAAYFTQRASEEIQRANQAASSAAQRAHGDYAVLLLGKAVEVSAERVVTQGSAGTVSAAMMQAASRS